MKWLGPLQWRNVSRSPQRSSLSQHHLQLTRQTATELLIMLRPLRLAHELRFRQPGRKLDSVLVSH